MLATTRCGAKPVTYRHGLVLRSHLCAGAKPEALRVGQVKVAVGTCIALITKRCARIAVKVADSILTHALSPQLGELYDLFARQFARSQENGSEA